jgi:hypothetical protein
MAITLPRVQALLAAAEHYRNEYNRVRAAAADLSVAVEEPAVAIFLASFVRPENLASQDVHVETLLRERMAQAESKADSRRRERSAKGPSASPGAGNLPRAPYGAKITQTEEDDPWTK